MPPAITSPSREITIPLTGTTCRSCARRLEYRLRRLDSVSAAEVDRVAGTVKVAFAHTGGEAAVLEAIRGAGYDPAIATVTLPVPGLGYGAEAEALEVRIAAEPGIKRARAIPAEQSVEVDYVVGTANLDAAREGARRAGFDARHPETRFDAAARLAIRRRSTARLTTITILAAVAATFVALPFFWSGTLRIPALDPRSAQLILAAGAVALVVALARSWMLGALRPWLRGVPSADGLSALAVIAAVAGALAAALAQAEVELRFAAWATAFWVIGFVSLSRWLIARVAADGDDRHRDLDSLSRKLTILSAAAAVLAFFIWFVLGQEPALVNAITAFVATLAVSCASLAAIAATAATTQRNRTFHRAGIGMNSATALRQLHDVDVVLFEVHGTLTTGLHRVSEYVLIAGMSQKDLLRVAATLAHGSPDRVLRALDAHAPTPVPLIAERLEEFEGISARVDGVPCHLGRPAWLRSRGLSLDGVEDDIARFVAEGRSVRVLALDHSVAGVLAFREDLRDDARSQVERIRTLRAPLYLLSDTDEAALESISRQVGVERRFAGSPSAQRSEISRLRRQGRSAAIITTDPSGFVASAADLTVALGSGTAADLEVSDLSAAATASEIAGNASAAIRSTTRFTVLWHLLALPVAAFPAAPVWPAIAAAAATAATSLAMWRACCRSPRVAPGSTPGTAA